AGRETMVRRVVEGGQPPQAVSEAVGVCPRTVRKWVARFGAEGVAGLRDRSSRPHRLCQPTAAATASRIEALRRRWTGAQISQETGVSTTTVSRVLRRLGLDRLKRHGFRILICAMNDGGYGSEFHKLRADGLDDRLAVFGRPALENIARGFGLRGHEIRDVSAIPKLFADFVAQGESEIWNIQISDHVTAP